jgi:hypothetical protein
MNAPGREEVDLKLQNLELKIEVRLAAIESGINDIKSFNASLKTTLILTAISVVFAVAGLNYALTSNLNAAFESGKDTGKDQSEVRKQLDATAALLKSLQEQVKKTQSVQSGPAQASPPAPR